MGEGVKKEREGEGERKSCTRTFARNLRQGSKSAACKCMCVCERERERVWFLNMHKLEKLPMLQWRNVSKTEYAPKC